MSKIIEVEVKTGSKLKRYEFSENDRKLKLYINEKPVDNKANEAVIKYLSDIFKTPQKNISIVKGLKNKLKIIQID
jgi:hypothetical protein